MGDNDKEGDGLGKWGRSIEQPEVDESVFGALAMLKEDHART